MPDPEIARKHARGDFIARAHSRCADIIPCGLDYAQRSRLTDVLSKVWDDGCRYGAAAPDDLREALISLRGCITTSARDMGEYRVDAWLYAVLVGWDCEDGQEDAAHVHDDICGGDGPMREMAARHGWSPEAVSRARRLRRAVAAATGGMGEEKQDA